jgi:hypothetical protein
MLQNLFNDAQQICEAENLTLYTVFHAKKVMQVAFTTNANVNQSSTIPIDQNSLPGIVAWTSHTMCVSSLKTKNVS